jgi:hypothetical protein
LVDLFSRDFSATCGSWQLSGADHFELDEPMKTFSNRTVILMFLSVLPGCATMNHTERGALAGGGLGAVAGAMIDRKDPVRGAAIGGLAGTALGAAAGNAADEQERKFEAAVASSTVPASPLSLEDVADLARRGVSDDVIRTQIRQSGTRFYLTPSQIAWLHDQGVSDRVINEMQRTASPAVRTHVRHVYEPVYVVPPPVYRPVPFPYGPTVSFGFGVWR